ncbi:helix-turn-helix domain-containing protein [Tenacibaculum sp. 190524A02b]|uniref:helix-turn-helix domain-containing protein n=1 Tax=Tenacibaculum vairaonense TaxID=3137860 RepID=UPI0031FB2BB9
MNSLEIRRIRNELGKTQAEFAEILGVSKNSVQLWETNKRNPSKSTAILIRDTYKKHTETHIKEEGEVALEKNGVKISLDEIALFAAENIEELKKKSVFYNTLVIEALKLLKKAQNAEGFIDATKLTPKQ